MSNRVEINEIQMQMLAPLVERRNQAQAQMDYALGLILAGAGHDPRAVQVIGLEDGALILDLPVDDSD
jgi:hypothetical protein